MAEKQKNVAVVVCWRQFRATCCRQEVKRGRPARAAPSAGPHGTLQPPLPPAFSSGLINTGAHEMMRERGEEAPSLLWTPGAPVLGKVLSQDQISEMDPKRISLVLKSVLKLSGGSAKAGWAQETPLKETHNTENEMIWPDPGARARPGWFMQNCSAL